MSNIQSNKLRKKSRRGSMKKKMQRGGWKYDSPHSSRRFLKSVSVSNNISRKNKKKRRHNNV